MLGFVSTLSLTNQISNLQSESLMQFNKVEQQLIYAQGNDASGNETQGNDAQSNDTQGVQGSEDQIKNSDYKDTLRPEEEEEVMSANYEGEIFQGPVKQKEFGEYLDSIKDQIEDPYRENYNKKIFHKASEQPKQESLMKVLVPIHNGYEDIETSTIIDILNRAGAHIITASCNPTAPLSELVKGAYGTQMLANFNIEDCQNYEFDLIVLPGGMKNSEGLAQNEVLINMLKSQKENNRWYASICASPAVVFEPHGLMVNEKGTAYPGLSDKLADQSEVNNEVVVSNKCITSQGPATAAQFAFALVEKLFGEEKVKSIKSDMLYK